MLAPSLLDVEDDLAATANLLWNIGGFAESCLLADVAQQSPPIDWVDEVRAILSDCRTVAESWLDAKASVVAPLSVAFPGYASLVSAAAVDLSASMAERDWAEFLTDLQATALANSEGATGAQQVLTRHQTDFEGAHERLKTAIQRAQDGLEAEQADIAEIAVRLQALTDRLATFGVGSTVAAMAGGQSILQTLVKINYDTLIDASAAVPYVSIVVMLYSAGSSIHTQVVDDEEISSLLRQISALLVKLDEDERALAMTHALLQQLSRMNEAYIGAAKMMPRINGYWDAEVDKVGEILSSLRAGAQPVLLTDIVSLPVAATVWQKLAKMAKVMAVPVTSDNQQVTLSISAPPLPSGS